MAEMNVKKTRRMHISHRGRGAQVWIYLGKMLRMFIYQSDWKVMPMAALIAGLVGMVVRNRLFLNREGTLIGGFAMVCVCIWNGCFNSIQVICRERDVIKREHRSGMHISSYIFSHMVYQALLCLLQTGVTLFVSRRVGIRYDLGQPLFTNGFIVDYGISMFLITYAADMMSLWISSIAHTTTAAMTIMPFVLIFQLVFSGGMFTLPNWTKYITPFTISNPGLRVLAAQGDYNHRPMVAVWSQVEKMGKQEIDATVTLGQVMELLGKKDNPAVAQIRSTQISRVFTLGEARQMLEQSESFKNIRQAPVLSDMTLGDILQKIDTEEQFQSIRDIDFGVPGMSLGKLLHDMLGMQKLQKAFDTPLTQATTVGDLLDAIDASGALNDYNDMPIGADITLGELVDMLAANPDVQANYGQSYTFHSTVDGVIDMIGRDKAKDILQNKIASASNIDDYQCTQENVIGLWFSLFLFVLGFAALATITLEFIDKDKR